MKSLSIALLLTLTTFAAFAADPAAASDQEKLVQHLERTRDRFLKSVDGLSGAQWNYKAAPDKWSIAQCAEHIAAAEGLIRGAVDKAMAAPAISESNAKDDAVLQFTVDRSKKFDAPEPLVPSDRFGSPAAALETFRTERAATLKLAASGADFRKHATAHPGFGPLDAYGWLLFLSAHSERHTLQIEEVKASPGFPAK